MTCHTSNTSQTCNTSPPPNNPVTREAPVSLCCPSETEAGGSPFELLYTTLSSQTDAADTKNVMETFLMKRRKNVLGPPVGKVRVFGGGGATLWHQIRLHADPDPAA
jgi:hypothetical protein